MLSSHLYQLHLENVPFVKNSVYLHHFNLYKTAVLNSSVLAACRILESYNPALCIIHPSPQQIVWIPVLSTHPDLSN